MKLLFDFFPIILFFAAYKLAGIYTATAVAIVATAGQLGWGWFRHHRVEKMHLVTFAIILVLGGATLIFRDPTFIKWKPTVVYGLFAVTFLGSQFIGEHTLVERMLSHAVKAPPFVWQRLNIAWVFFFLCMGMANLYVAYNYSEAFWVNFKLFGLLGFTVLFVLLQGFFLARYVEEASDEPQSGSGS